MLTIIEKNKNDFKIKISGMGKYVKLDDEKIKTVIWDHIQILTQSGLRT